MQPFVGQLICVGFNFAPRGWLLCQGQLLSIQQNPALFSLLGTTYGGNGVTTFALPDLRGRVTLHYGQGNGLSSYTQGEAAGLESVSLLGSQLPTHSHPVMGSNSESSTTSPGDATFAAGGSYASAVNASMSKSMIAPSGGGSQPHDNHQPYVVMNWIIATEGIFPPRS